MARSAAVIEAPPSRYRVVERGRRLEVIDTGRREPVPRPACQGPAPRSSIAARLPRRTAFDGSAALTTSALYDEKAPRTIALDPASAAIVRWTGIGIVALTAVFIGAAFFWPWLFAVIPLFADKRAREPARRMATRWLDKVEREAN